MSAEDKYIFLIEDNDMLRSELERILISCEYSVSSFSNAGEFLNQFNLQAPAIIISDMRMPGLSGVELQAELRSRGCNIPMIFISGESSDEQIVKAFKDGASDFLLKPFSRAAFLDSVAKSIEQEMAAFRERISKALASQVLNNLSPRERQVFELLSVGYGNKELMEELKLSLPTVKEYKSEVMYKLQLNSLAELIALSSQIKRT
jgi:FixJ family two-component response regulator